MKTSITLAIAAGLIFSGCGKRDDTPQTSLDEDVVPVRLATITSATETEPVRVSGTVASLEEARLSFKTGGMISRIFVREGQTFRKGQLLAILDQTEITAQVNQARYAFEKSERDQRRVDNMLKDTAATLEQLQNASTALDVSRQNLSIAEFNQNYSKIVAPFDGTVTRKLANEGEVTGPGTPALIITSSRQNDWIVKVSVADKDWARIRQHDAAKVFLDAYPGQEFVGKVSSMAQSADPVNRLYELEIRIEPAGKKLASGLYARVELNAAEKASYLVIPVEALIEGNGSAGFVFVQNGDKAKRVPVKVGFVNGDKVMITAGLDSVQQVITSGSAFLADGVQVKISH